MANAPRFDDAPGIVVRGRKDGSFSVWWQARSDLVRAGYKPKVVPLWSGTEPSDADRARISDVCNAAQAEMLLWGRAGRFGSASYDGTVRTLVACYKHDAQSPFNKLRYGSKQTYGYFLKYIEQDRGARRIEDIRTRDVLDWHNEWKTKRGVAMAHGLITQFRALLSFGGSLLECEHCLALKMKLSEQRFEQGRPRSSVLTAEMAEAIRAMAHRMGRPSIALAQAIQFEGMLRQRDVIGEYVPLDEPGPLSEVTYQGKKWIRGIRWEEIDENLVLRHVTSKRQKEVEIRLADAPMVVAELAKIERRASGPVIVNERTKRPYTPMAFRALWREIATAVKVPSHIRNQDSRAGAITEATQAGADLESIKHAAAHSDIAMTQRYARSGVEKSAKVLQMRAAHRTKT